jgi:hypothetical protein
LPGPQVPPAGTSPLGNFAPITLADPGHAPGYLADDIDPATGDLRSILSGLDPVDAMVIQAIRVEDGSGASTNGTGNRFRQIKKVDDGVQQAIRFEYERCLSGLVKRRLIRIDQVVVNVVGDDAVSSFCLYTNLTTGQQQKASFQP